MSWVERYKSPEIDAIFSSEQRLKYQIEIELIWLKTLFKCSTIEMKGFPTLERVQELEKETDHDIAAMIKALSESIKNESIASFVHYCLTSQDINDTVMGLQLKKSHKVLMGTGNELKNELRNLTIKYRDTLCVARTHGQHAIPITMGWKFANFLNDWFNCLLSFSSSKQFIKGKLSGAVGTSAAHCAFKANLSEYHDVDNEKIVLDILGLKRDNITTQIISRINLVSFIQPVILMVCQLERIAKEIRNLQRTEISEFYEEFTDTQVGSSAMPQKRNPIGSENICGLARVIRGQLNPLFETISLEHERDLTNSSVERVIIPTILGLTHYIMRRMINILKKLRVDEDRCYYNLNMTKGRELSERVMNHLIFSNGTPRSEAHEILNRNINNSQVRLNDQLRNYDGIDKLMNHRTYLGKTETVIDNVLALTGFDLE